MEEVPCFHPASPVDLWPGESRVAVCERGKDEEGEEEQQAQGGKGSIVEEVD